MYQVPHMHELPDASDEDFLCENQMCDYYQRYARGENSSVFYAIDILPELKILITGWLSYILLRTTVNNADSDFNSIISIFQDFYWPEWDVLS